MTTPKLANVCAVIGVGPGLGLSLCRRFGQEGFKVAMLARQQDRLAAFRRTLADEDIRAYTYKADAGDAESLTAALDDVQAKLGSPDVLIYNAVQFHLGAVSSLENRALGEALQTSVVGALVATKITHGDPTQYRHAVYRRRRCAYAPTGRRLIVYR